MEPTKLCFFDDFWLDFRVGTIRRWYDPQLIGSYYDPAFCASAAANVLYDKDAGLYRVIYYATGDSGQDEDRACCMASTRDFVHFEPVELRPEAPVGRRHIIHYLEDSTCIECVTLDRAEPDPAKRFKCTGLHMPGDVADYSRIRMVGATSPDAIHWNIDLKNPLHPTTSDADNNILYNPVTGEYMLFFRAAYVDRRICCKTSKDLKHWSDAVVTVHPGASYNNEAHEIELYGMVPTYSNGVFYAMMQVFSTSLTDMDFSKMWGFVDTELYYSYDGYHYMPTSGRMLVQRPAAPEFGCAQLYLMHLCESADGHDYILSGSGSKVIHGTTESNIQFTEKLGGKAFGCVFYRVRKDGFCGIEGMGVGAKVITKPLQLEEPVLSINANASCGYIRYGIMRRDGTWLDGFSFDDCDPMEFTDSVDHALTWKNHDLREALGQQIRIAVELNGATLHAMTLAGRPCIRRPQKSFADPTQLT